MTACISPVTIDMHRASWSIVAAEDDHAWWRRWPDNDTAAGADIANATGENSQKRSARNDHNTRSQNPSPCLHLAK